MEKGDRIDVFEVLTINWRADFKTGQWVSEEPNGPFHGNPFGVNIFDSTRHLGLDERNEIKKVGTLIIKTIKC